MDQRVFKYINLVHSRYPQLRVGQIMENAAKLGGWLDSDLFYCPDATMINGLRLLCGEVERT